MIIIDIIELPKFNRSEAHNADFYMKHFKAMHVGF